jgi:prolipoprotein diacylglyceryltransferase
VQLYELFGCLALTPFVWFGYLHGSALPVYLVGYGALRIAVERYRDNGHEHWLGRSVWQWLSFALMAVGLLLLFALQPSVPQVQSELLLPSGVMLDMAAYGSWSFIVLSVAYGLHVRHIGRWL